MELETMWGAHSHSGARNYVGSSFSQWAISITGLCTLDFSILSQALEQLSCPTIMEVVFSGSPSCRDCNTLRWQLTSARMVWMMRWRSPRNFMLTSDSNSERKVSISYVKHFLFRQPSVLGEHGIVSSETTRLDSIDIVVIDYAWG